MGIAESTLYGEEDPGVHDIHNVHGVNHNYHHHQDDGYHQDRLHHTTYRNNDQSEPSIVRRARPLRARAGSAAASEGMVRLPHSEGPYKINGVVLGLPKTGKEALLKRLKGKDPFGTNKPRTITNGHDVEDEVTMIKVPYRPPQGYLRYDRNLYLTIQKASSVDSAFEQISKAVVRTQYEQQQQNSVPPDQSQESTLHKEQNKSNVGNDMHFAIFMVDPRQTVCKENGKNGEKDDNNELPLQLQQYLKEQIATYMQQLQALENQKQQSEQKIETKSDQTQKTNENDSRKKPVICIAILLNFRDLKPEYNDEGKEQQKNGEDMQPDQEKKIPSRPSWLSLSEIRNFIFNCIKNDPICSKVVDDDYFHLYCNWVSVKNCYGLASLHHFIYQAYILHKQRDLELMLQSIKDSKQKAFQVDNDADAISSNNEGNTYKEFIKLVELQQQQEQEKEREKQEQQQLKQKQLQQQQQQKEEDQREILRQLQEKSRQQQEALQQIEQQQRQISKPNGPGKRINSTANNVHQMAPPKIKNTKQSLEDFFASSSDDSDDGGGDKQDNDHNASSFNTSVRQKQQQYVSSDEDDDFFYNESGQKVQHSSQLYNRTNVIASSNTMSSNAMNYQVYDSSDDDDEDNGKTMTNLPSSIPTPSSPPKNKGSIMIDKKQNYIASPPKNKGSIMKENRKQNYIESDDDESGEFFIQNNNDDDSDDDNEISFKKSNDDDARIMKSAQKNTGFPNQGTYTISSVSAGVPTTNNAPATVTRGSGENNSVSTSKNAAALSSILAKAKEEAEAMLKQAQNEEQPQPMQQQKSLSQDKSKKKHKKESKKDKKKDSKKESKKKKKEKRDKL